MTTVNRTFPYYRSLSFVLQSFVRSLGEHIQSLFKGLSGGVQRFLGLLIVIITLLVQLVSTSAEIRSREQISNSRKQSNSEICGISRS